jgi:putative DNA primase/helicase
MSAVLVDEDIFEPTVTAASPEPRDSTPTRAGEYRGRQKFVVAAAAEWLLAEDHYATGGSQTYVFDGGCYRPGEAHLKRKIIDLLGDEWTKRRSEDVIAYVRIAAPELWARPPLERINVRNGLLDLASGELAAHSPEHFSPVQLGAAFDPLASCPRIDAFLSSTIPELEGLFEEIVGYLLTPDNRQQRAIMFVGPGGTGKSTAAAVSRALLGPENVSSVALHQLEEDRFATADLYGCLANVFADLPSHALRSSSIFKSITGGDAIRAERKHRDAFTFTPYARLLFSANEVPPTADNSDAFFDRWLILPFDHKHRGTDHVDPDLVAKLTTPHELSGLLNRALTGLERVRRNHGFTRAAVSEHAAKRFRVDSDSVAGFVEESCEIGVDGRVAKPVLFQMYRRWCEENNRKPLGAQRFNHRLAELCDGRLDQVSSKGRDYWIRITCHPRDES